MRNKVSFFIIGAPKCGTTSLHDYLSTHPDVCFSVSKEPNYFSYDFPGYRTTHSIKEYHQKEFRHCGSNAALLGESSVWYLYSKVAVKEIHNYNPDAKIIIMLRNPIDMLYSLHSQLLYNLDEDATDFEDAWELQELRENDRELPKRCRVPEFLQYKNIGLFSGQIKRVYQYFPKHQVKVILFDDLVHDSKGVYLSVLDFLGLQNDNKKLFHIANPNKALIFKPLAVLVQRPPKSIEFVVGMIKRLFGVHRLGVYSILNKLNMLINTRQEARKPLSDEFKKTILLEFMEDISETERIIGKDLSHWKK